MTMDTGTDQATSRLDQPTFDPDALRRKYREERDKRLREDGNDQYIEVLGDFAHYAEDPYTARVDRPAFTDEVEVAIIGGGFGGLLAGARLREAGVEDLRLIEKGGDVGGTWYWNRYPGAQCDVESYIYLPLLEELNYVPTEKYAHGPEILAHSQAIARHYRLYDNACLHTEVTGVEWDEVADRWLITTNRGDAMRAKFVCMSNGPLHRPKLPGIQGIEKFKGHSFHTSRWDYEYTGGDSNGGLAKLSDKVVAIIGTGATAVQCVPHLGEAAEHLYVFQRTPSSIDVRNNRPTEPEWVNSLEPGWQKRRMENFNTLLSGIPQEEDLVNDGWTDIVGKLLFKMRNDSNVDFSMDGIMRTMEVADFEKMEEIRARVDMVVQDSEAAEALKPYYRQFCKRPCFHDEYLETFNRPNVTLVDTQGGGVEQVTERGVVVGGKEYEVDCLIFATGFEVGTSYTRRCGYDIVGRNGVTLSQKWADGAMTLHGMHSRGFPNCLFMGHVQSAFTANYPHLLDEQATHLAYIVRQAQAANARTVEPSEEAEAEWVQTILKEAHMMRRFFEDCTPGYYNNEGRPGDRSAQDGAYGGGSLRFFQILNDWRKAGTLEGLELMP